MRFLILVLLFSLLIVSQINTIVDNDLWFHIKSGEYTAKNISILKYDIFSYTLSGQPWVHYDWLSGLLFYLVFSHLGWLGLNILKALTIMLCFFVIFLLSLPKNKKMFNFIFFAGISILAFGYRSFVRPEMFSCLLLCIFFYILEKDRYVYMLPILEIVWANLHGYFIIGPAFILLYLIGECVSGNFKKTKKLLIIFCLSILVCLVTPYFYSGILYNIQIIKEMFAVRNPNIQTIHELTMPVSFSFCRYIFFWILAILSSFTFLVNLKKAKINHALVFLTSFMASYMASRYMPVFIFIAMPIAVMNLNEVRLTEKIEEKKYYGLIALAICAMIYIFISNKYYAFTNQSDFKKTGSSFSRLLIPSGACDFLERNGIKGRIFNTLDFGPYIAYRFFPEKKIFIDTRIGLYRDDFYESYRKAQNYPRELERLRRMYNFKIVLVRHLFTGTERISRYLYKSQDWILAYYDENSAVFVYKMPAYKLDLAKKKIEKEDLNISLARFFQNLGEVSLAEKIYHKLLESDPVHLEAGNNLSSIYINSGRSDDALRLLEGLLKRHPKSAELYVNIGAAFLVKGEREQAQLMLEKALKINPYVRYASYMLGLVYKERGDIDRALRQFSKYITLDPYNPNVHRIMGDIYTQKGYPEKADSEYKEADALEGLEK